MSLVARRICIGVTFAITLYFVLLYVVMLPSSSSPRFLAPVPDPGGQVPVSGPECSNAIVPVPVSSPVYGPGGLAPVSWGPFH